MVKETFLRLPDEKKNRILSSAAREFTERGYEKSSINRILEEAKIPKGSFYQYFDDKSDLFYLSIRSVYEKILSARAEKNEKLLGSGMLRMKKMGYEKGFRLFWEELRSFLKKEDFTLFQQMLEAPPAIRNYVQMTISAELIAPVFREELAGDPDVREDIDLDYFAYLLSLTEMIPADYGARRGMSVEETVYLGFRYMQAIYDSITK